MKLKKKKNKNYISVNKIIDLKKKNECLYFIIKESKEDFIKIISLNEIINGEKAKIEEIKIDVTISEKENEKIGKEEENKEFIKENEEKNDKEIFEKKEEEKLLEINKIFKFDKLEEFERIKFIKDEDDKIKESIEKIEKLPEREDISNYEKITLGGYEKENFRKMKWNK